MTTPDAAVRAALAHAEYRTSTFSSGNGACVMIAHTAGWVGLRDSKDPTQTTLPATHSQWLALLTATKSNHLS